MKLIRCAFCSEIIKKGEMGKPNEANEYYCPRCEEYLESLCELWRRGKCQ